ncbi:RagB/SusD family nutrient uptake outer membrane protein [Chitinophaga sp. Mgbs1]|uniref:RagB/SusD family nutrient uptake outer membrane protein n=1 Tax=Chitinophaga solisilvae TaxID=1233460 RepID=A0A433WGC4_9BACT|nr:RagB/SusD family nutrient uptake outer membrane protein [Chitinophaga solisilvae]
MKKYSVYILALAALMTGSCQKDKLTPAPATHIPDFKIFDNPERVGNLLNGVYSIAKGGAFLGGKMLVANDVRGEDFTNITSNSVTLNLAWRMTSNGTSQEVLETWSRGYRSINNANVFIDGMTAKGSQVVGEANGKKFIAEAKFIRALSYFYLLQLYARPYWDDNGKKLGLVIYTEGHTSLGDYNRARSTVAETYAQILKDLNEAEAALPAAVAGAPASITHATASAAVALKTRVYLYMGNYPKVIEEANKIVSAAAPFVSPQGYQLNADVTKVFAVDAKSVTKESIFSFPFTSNPGDFPETQTQLGQYFNAEFMMDTTGIGIYSDASWKVDTDARRKFIRKADGTKLYFWNKFSTGSPYTDWVPVIRYAEILLNLAEAKARISGVDAQAVALLNAVRNRSDATVTYTTGSFADGPALLAAIAKEKHIEFIGEGMRGMEITRLGIPFPAKAGGIATVPAASNKYIWPISADELVYNKLCVDNL